MKFKGICMLLRKLKDKQTTHRG